MHGVECMPHHHKLPGVIYRQFHAQHYLSCTTAQTQHFDTQVACLVDVSSALAVIAIHWLIARNLDFCVDQGCLYNNKAIRSTLLAHIHITSWVSHIDSILQHLAPIASHVLFRVLWLAAGHFHIHICIGGSHYHKAIFPTTLPQRDIATWKSHVRVTAKQPPPNASAGRTLPASTMKMSTAGGDDGWFVTK